MNDLPKILQEILRLRNRLDTVEAQNERLKEAIVMMAGCLAVELGKETVKRIIERAGGFGERPQRDENGHKRASE